MPSIYVHIPYCLSKCAYCDFYSSASESVPDDYVNAVIKRILKANLCNIQSLYFGGGTPSLLTARQVTHIIDACHLAPNAEVTLEANPETVSLEKMQSYKSAGVNRVSLGVQTAYDHSLARIGRVHSADTSQQALNNIRNAGITNISGDIMLSLPHYTKAEFDATLQLLCRGEVTHISCYMLKIEPNTAFGENVPQGLLTDDAQADMYLYAVAQLEKAGYHQYEISNFAQNGYESQHNLVYWNCHDYLGIGAAAHSCMGNKRYYYPSNSADFINDIEPVYEGDCTAEDYIMLQLRLNKGLCLTQLKALWQYELSSKQVALLHQCVKAKYATLADDIVALTPKGMLIQNIILGQFI